jgi:hypothetical protein
LNNQTNTNQLTLKEFFSSVENIDRACSTVIENSIAIFLPHKRLDKTDIQKKFYANNQILEIESDLFEKVEIRGRLLGQQHKDILEVLLSSQIIYDKTYKRFKTKLTAYNILKRLKKDPSNKKWLIQKLDEIAECRIKIHFNDENNDVNGFNFNFINSIQDKNQREITINFTPEYTHFMAKNEMLDYREYVDDILSIKNDFIKAVVRYMLINNGKNSQIGISKLLDKMKYEHLVSAIDLERDIRELKRPETQAMLIEKFGIYLTNDESTLTFNKNSNKKHYFIEPSLDL